MSDELPYSLMWWSWNELLALISNLVECHSLWRVLKWVSVHQFPEFLWIVSCCWVWRVLKWVNVHYCTEFCFWGVLKGVSLSCNIACCLDSNCPICFVWWCTAVLAASQPLPWLHRGCSLGLHGELSSDGLHWDLSSVHGGLPGLLGCHWLHCGLSSSVLHGDLSSLHGGVPGLLRVTWAVCLLAVWLCVAGVGSLWSCASCSLWVLLSIYGWFLVWNKT